MEELGFGVSEGGGEGSKEVTEFREGSKEEKKAGSEEIMKRERKGEERLETSE